MVDVEAVNPMEQNRPNPFGGTTRAFMGIRRYENKNRRK